MARVYVHADGSRYAKLVSRSEIGELADERDRVDWARARRIPGPQVLHWSDNQDGACLITSAVSGIGADQVEPGQAAQAWPNIVRAVRDLHDTPIAGCPFDRRLARMFALAGKVVAHSAVNPEFLRPEQQTEDPRTLLAGLSADLPTRQEQEETDLVICHGDLCLPNILLDPTSLRVNGFIDLGRLGVADRHADLSLLLANAVDTWPHQAQALRDELEPLYGTPIDAERLRFYVHLDPLTWADARP